MPINPESVFPQPENDVAHYNLGMALEKRGDPRERWGKHRVANELKPDDSDFRASVQRVILAPPSVSVTLRCEVYCSDGQLSPNL